MRDLVDLIAPEGVRDAKYRAARGSLWQYCQLTGPKFFLADRAYLAELAEVLQAAYERRLINPVTGKPYRKLMINLPPRHGKSYSLTSFCQWVLGVDNTTRIISVSYNETLAVRFARQVRDGIDATKIDPSITIFNDIFPGTHIKYGDASAQLWALDGQFFNYLSTGFGGTITGVGCSIGIIDDPVKNSVEAYNDRALDDQWGWYRDTFLSRVEEDGLIIINMTRWSTKDLCGRLLASEEADDWYVHCRPAYNAETDSMLCEEILSRASYEAKRRIISPPIMDANYQQQPVDIEGRLYTSFATYEQLPPKVDRIVSYTDTADTGSDYLCSIAAAEAGGVAYVLDVIYTQRPMEVTEPLVARQLHSCGVQDADIESNNGGRGFARNVERHLREDYGNYRCKINWFMQTQNKRARILAGATGVMAALIMPADWARRWPEYYTAMRTYQATGSNAHDDAQDTSTGIIERLQERHSRKLRTISKSRMGL